MRIWPLLADERSRTAIVVAEQFADGLATEGELIVAETAAKKAERAQGGWRHYGASACACLARKHAGEAVRAWWYVTALAEWKRAEERSVTPEDRSFKSTMEEAREEELAQHTPLLRDIFGHPFRPATFDAAWLTSTAVTLAKQMYESRDFGTMPILADALEDAGCTSDDILSHCRGPGPHVRGCWVVDLVLGKE
jgi:hypothetical protein